MQTEPEQWAVELWTEARRRHDVAKRSPGFYNQEPELIAALTIQRAFEERERKLRETALEALKAARPFVNPNTFPGTATPVREKIDVAIATLKETPDDQ